MKRSACFLAVTVIALFAGAGAASAGTPPTGTCVQDTHIPHGPAIRLVPCPLPCSIITRREWANPRLRRAEARVCAVSHG